MPLNPDFIGRSYGPTDPYEVSREKIRDFALATGDPNPLYLSPEAAQAAGYADVIAPPTFLTVTGFRFPDATPVADPELGLDYTRVVHGEQSYTHQRPVVAGDRLRVRTTVEEIRVAGRNELMVLRTDVTDAAGELVSVGRTTVVSRGSAA